MASANQWWVIWANNQPIKGVGVTASVFYGTKAQADSQAAKIVDGTVTGPYSSKQDAENAIKAAGGNTSKGNKNVSVNNPPPGPQNPNIGNPLKGLDAIGAFFNSLGQASTWVRVVKVLVGSVMLVSGIVHLTGVDKAALGIAGKVILPGKIPT